MINKHATTSSHNIMQILNNITWLSCIWMLKVTHMGVTIGWPQEAETFSILSVWAGERQAAGHAPRGIHLSLTSTLWAVATGNRGNVRDFSFSLVTLSNKEALYITSSMLSCFFVFFLIFLENPLTAEKQHPSTQCEMFLRKTNLYATLVEHHLLMALWCYHFPVLSDLKTNDGIWAI